MADVLNLQDEAAGEMGVGEEETQLQQPTQLERLPSDVVIARIEQLCTEFISCLGSGSIMGLQMMPLPALSTSRAGAALQVMVVRALEFKSFKRDRRQLRQCVPCLCL